MKVIDVKNITCQVCASAEVSVFFEMPAVPVFCNLLWPERDAALQTPRADIVLGFCESCGFIYNLAFDPSWLVYNQRYENSLHFSPRFQAYAETLAARLIAQYDLHDKDVIEIGCGRGDFLTLLCDLGGNRGVGFDPSYEKRETTARVTFIPDLYSEHYAGHKADFVCCRHVLEHIQHPKHFLKSVRRAIGGRRHVPVYFEVPNALFTLRDLGVWDIIYEHCSYFCAPSLARLFAECGFNVSALSEAFANQFLGIEAMPAETEESPGFANQNELEPLAHFVVAFGLQYRRKVEAWTHQMEQMARNGLRAVIWGAGSKGVTFLNTLALRDQIEYVVDLNPRKRGMFIAGTGQQIVSPDFLREYRPDVVIVMNPIYSDEIRRDLAAMEVFADLILV
jgi:SAM-dependent methyltransferase